MNCDMKKCISAHPYKFVIGIFIIIVVIIGATSAYSSYRQNQAMKLAQKYFTMSTQLQASNADEKSITSTMQEIDSINKNSIYSNMGHLLFAKYFFEHKKYDASLENVKFVIDHSANDNMLLLAYLREGNIYIAKQDFEAVKIIILDKNLTGNVAFAPAIYELKGDMYLAQKNYSQAIASYKQILKLDVSEDVKRGAKVKLQLLGVNS